MAEIGKEVQIHEVELPKEDAPEPYEPEEQPEEVEQPLEAPEVQPVGLPE